MKKTNPFELSHKKYCTDYREIKKIWTSTELELLMLRNLSSKKRNIALKKYMANEAQLPSYLKDIKSLMSLREVKGINRFVGYTLHTDGNKRQQFKSWIMFIYEFGETDLLEFARRHHLSSQRRQDLPFLQQLPTRIVQLYSSLQTYTSIDLSCLMVDHDLIILDHYRQPHQSLKLCYFPFAFLKEHHLANHYFNTHVYSSRELRSFNRERQEKPELPPHLKVSEIILESQRETDSTSCNLQTLHKIGLSLLKFIYLFCRDISINQPHFQLYCMNQQFDIDFNWNQIQLLLADLQKEKQYRQLAKQLKYMVRECQEEKTFAEYLQDIKLIRNNHSKKKERLEQDFKTAERHNHIPHHSRFYSFEDKGVEKLDQNLSQLQKIKDIEARLVTKQTEVIHYEDGSMYRGQIRNGQRHGLGIYTFAQGDVFGGQWQNNSMSGQGFYYFTNNERYQGQIQGGVKHGYGTYYYKNGDFYCGMWKNDVKQGKGQFFSSEVNELYKGEFKDNLKTKYGIVFYANNQRFEGYFANGMRNGEGCVYDSSGKIYLKSTWKNDVIDGMAQLFMPNNDYFIGLMSKNKKNGKGIYKYSNGTIYEGQFMDDRQQGECTIQFANGDRYQGRVKDGKFEGYGRYSYRSADMVYEGQWKDGKENGKGIYRYRGGLELEADVEKGDLIRYIAKRSSQKI